MMAQEKKSTLQALFVRVRRIDDISSLRPTSAELKALRKLLAAVLDLAWSHAGHRIPKSANFYGVKVYIDVTLAGQVFLKASPTGPSLIASGPFRV